MSSTARLPFGGGDGADHGTWASAEGPGKARTAAREGDAGGGVVEERLGGGGGAREGSERGEVVGGSHGRLVGIGGGSRRRRSHGGSEEAEVEMLH